MRNVLLVEPDYRSKFPPLGLLRISSYHKHLGDSVTFVRGLDETLRSLHWHRIYVASLFTWELPRTVKTVRFYADSVASPYDIFVGGIAATLMPEYVRENTTCTVLEGRLDKKGMLGPNSPPIAELPPDYGLLDLVDYDYQPRDAFFVRITKGCFRSCKFCAVPRLETRFSRLTDVTRQVSRARRAFRERQDLILLDNNVLGIDGIEEDIQKIRLLGFERGAKHNGRERRVDFNQGLDARVVSEKPELARHLSTICLSPVRLAFDFVTPSMERAYREAVELLSDQGFVEFTTYLLFNFQDTPEDFYHRLMVNVELNEQLRIRITGFPMRFVPMSAVRRDYVSQNWTWRYLRGIQCVLLATRGLISPNPEFTRAAFGETYEEFLEILAMPDRYIIHRKAHKADGANEWRKHYRALSPQQKAEFLDLLAVLNGDRNKRRTISTLGRYRDLLEHYYPEGSLPDP